MRGLSVAGSSGSSAGTSRCPVITACAPAVTAARNGASSTASSRARSPPMRGRSWWESTRVSPCPGKCLAQAATPPACRPRTQAAVCRATRAGSAPNERTPITGFAGFELTSASGA
ncbi:hypothetical protein B0E53_06787 [Micromonospora sp. MH33]|nr:hypothetical protein B0E53_06787 [Micromonospora sp. MH33]